MPGSSDRTNPTNVEATAQLRITVKDGDPERAGDSTRLRWRWPAIPDSTSPLLPPRARSTAVAWPASWWSPRWSTPTGTGWRCRTPCTWPSRNGYDDQIVDASPDLARARRRPGARRRGLATIRRPALLRAHPSPAARDHWCPVRLGGNANVGLWARSERALELARRIPHLRRVPRPAPRSRRAGGATLRLPESPALNFVVVALYDCIPRPRAWASTFGADWSTCRSLLPVD